MIKLLIKGIFWVVTKLFDIIFSPVLSVIFGLFPAVGSFFQHITEFLQLALTYVRTVLNLVCINNDMIVAIFDYFIILYSIWLSMLAVRFAVKIYNKFKI